MEAPLAIQPSYQSVSLNLCPSSSFSSSSSCSHNGKPLLVVTVYVHVHACADAYMLSCIQYYSQSGVCMFQSAPGNTFKQVLFNPTPAHQELQLCLSLSLSSHHLGVCRVHPYPSIMLYSLVGLSLPSVPTESVYLLCDPGTLRNQLLSPTSRDKKMEVLTERQPRRWRDWLCCMSVRHQPILFNARQQVSITLLL